MDKMQMVGVYPWFLGKEKINRIDCSFLFFNFVNELEF